MTLTVYVQSLKKAAVAAALACLLVGVDVAVAHAEGYQRGPSGFGFASRGANGGNRSNGYNGSAGSINRPHRGDWMRKLSEQRRYDQYLQKQAGSTAACGFTGAPSYCYTLVTKPRYPAEYRIVRY